MAHMVLVDLRQGSVVDGHDGLHLLFLCGCQIGGVVAGGGLDLLLLEELWDQRSCVLLGEQVEGGCLALAVVVD